MKTRKILVVFLLTFFIPICAESNSDSESEGERVEKIESSEVSLDTRRCLKNCKNRCRWVALAVMAHMVAIIPLLVNRWSCGDSCSI